MNYRYLGVLLFSLVLTGVPLHAQSVITGRVVDNDTKESLPGVSVSVKGTDGGDFTDSNGRFSVKVQSLPTTLVFSFIGFDTQEIDVTSAQELSIELKSGPVFLDEVVVAA